MKDQTFTKKAWAWNLDYEKLGLLKVEENSILKINLKNYLSLELQYKNILFAEKDFSKYFTSTSL